MDNKVSWRIGKRLDGRYEIRAVLGIGGMAVVYLARDQKLNRNVAIKVLRDDASMDDESRRRAAHPVAYDGKGIAAHRDDIERILVFRPMPSLIT